MVYKRRDQKYSQDDKVRIKGDVPILFDIFSKYDTISMGDIVFNSQHQSGVNYTYVEIELFICPFSESSENDDDDDVEMQDTHAETVQTTSKTGLQESESSSSDDLMTQKNQLLKML